MMLRKHYRNLAIVSVLAGFALRSLAPVGYMPSAVGDGLLFELCPEQLPAGFVLSSAASHHDHHSQSASDTSQPADSPDQCQIGHLLFSAIAVDAPMVDAIQNNAISEFIPSVTTTLSSATTSAYRSRAPPA
jgi:hypothetical protein